MGGWKLCMVTTGGWKPQSHHERVVVMHGNHWRGETMHGNHRRVETMESSQKSGNHGKWKLCMVTTGGWKPQSHHERVVTMHGNHERVVTIHGNYRRVETRESPQKGGIHTWSPWDGGNNT